MKSVGESEECCEFDDDNDEDGVHDDRDDGEINVGHI